MSRAGLLLGPLIVLLLAAGVAVVVTDGGLPDDAGIAEDPQAPDAADDIAPDVADDEAGEQADPDEQDSAPRPSDDGSGRDVTLDEPAPSPTMTAPGDVTAPDEESEGAPQGDRAEPIDTRGTPDTPEATADAALPQTGGTPAGLGALLLAGAALSHRARRRLVHAHTG